MNTTVIFPSLLALAVLLAGAAWAGKRRRRRCLRRTYIENGWVVWQMDVPLPVARPRDEEEEQ